MESTIVTTTLTDGSEVFSVVFVDGSQKVVISALDKMSAMDIQTALDASALCATIDPL